MLVALLVAAANITAYEEADGASVANREPLHVERSSAAPCQALSYLHLKTPAKKAPRSLAHHPTFPTNTTPFLQLIDSCDSCQGLSTP